MLRLGIGTHHKFARLTDGEFRAHVAGVLAIAAASPTRGCLLIGEQAAEAVDIARAAGVSPRVARAAIAKLQAVGVLLEDEENRCLRVHDWDDVNPAPKADSTNAERQRRHRNTRRNGGVTPDVTPPEVKKLEEPQDQNLSLSSSAAPRTDEKATDDDRRLCRLLVDQMQARNPKAKAKSPTRWLTDMRLLRERDGNSAEEIEKAIRWVFRDSFWGGVIQSPGNLREHFPAIWDKLSQRAGEKSGGRVETSDEFLTRKGLA
jgi:hypothetical protein